MFGCHLRFGPAGYLKKMFDVLRTRSSNAIADQLMLWDAIVFDWLIGNTDAHLKNFSLLYGRDLRTIRLAPIYDVVSTLVYEQSTRNMAFAVGGARAIEDVDTLAWATAAKEAGLGEKMAVGRVLQMSARFSEALDSATRDLEAAGFNKAPELRDRIRETGGIRIAENLV